MDGSNQSNVTSANKDDAAVKATTDAPCESFWDKVERNRHKISFITSVITAAACVGMFLVVLISCLTIVPQLTSTIKAVNEELPVMDTALKNVSDLSTTLNDQINELSLSSRMDEITGMLKDTQTDVDGLITNTEKTLEQTLAKINAIDLESLNKSIEELHNVLSPISKLFGGGKN